MSKLYDEIVKKSYATCKRLENIVVGIVEKLEDKRYIREAPMSKQLSLASRATGVLANITELSQVLKSEGAEIVKVEDKAPDPRIPGLLERIKKLKEASKG